MSEGARRRYYLVLLLFSLCMSIMLIPVYLLFRNWGDFISTIPLLALILFGVVICVFSALQLQRHKTESVKPTEGFGRWFPLTMILVVIGVFLFVSATIWVQQYQDWALPMFLLGLCLAVVGIVGLCYGMFAQAYQEKRFGFGTKLYPNQPTSMSSQIKGWVTVI